MALRLVVDTNLLFECKPLEDLPWAELHADPIALVLAKPVLDEIDKHKNGAGRTKKRALKIFSSIRSMLKEKAVEIVVRESAPRVVIKLLPTTSPLEQFKGDLNYDKNDDRLVGITATLQSDGGPETRLFSDDTGVASTATALGIPFEFIEDHWKREQEDDADTKHIKELQKEVKVLRLQEPQIVLKDAMERIGGRVEVTHKYPAALSPEEVTQLVDELRQTYPMRVDFVQKTVDSSKNENGLRYNYEPPTDEEIQEYHSREYPNWIEACQTTFQSLHGHVGADQPVMRLEWLMTNEGTRPAHNLRIEFEAKGVNIRRNDVKREQSHPDPAGQFRPKKKNIPALPRAPIPPAFRKVRILAETGSQSPSTGADISTIKGGLATNEVRRAINSLHAGEIDVSKLLGLDASLFSSDPELKRGLTDLGQQFAQDEAARRALFTPASRYTLPSLPRFPKPDDPETFYYEDWDNSRPTEAGALTCTLYRHGGKPEGFDFDVSFRGEEAQRGSVQCTVHAENLSQPVKHAIDVARKSELFSIMPIARQLIEGLK